MVVTVGEMFAGVGGFRLGLERANHSSRKHFSEQLRNRQSSPSEGNLQDSENGSEGFRENGGSEDYGISRRQGQAIGDDKGRVRNDTEQSDERQATFRVVWANELDKYACQIYRKNFGNKELVEGDIRQVKAEDLPDFDLLCAGFPCQSFSLAGKRQGFSDIRGTLFFEVARIAEAKRPKMLLLENVKGLLSAQQGYCFFRILEVLGELGYSVEYQVLNSKHYGVPQNRERVFIIGHLRGAGGQQIFPIESSGSDDDELGEETGGDGKGIQTGDFSPALRGGEKWSTFISPTLSAGYYKRQHGQLTIGNENLICLKRHRADEIRNHGELCPTLTESHEHKGGANPPIVVQPCLTPDRLQKRQNGRRFKEDGEPMFTLTGQDVHGVAIANCLDRDDYLRTGARPRDENGKPQLLPIGYRRIRRLTPVECERLQGFPDNWTQGVSDTQRYKLLGNAVTVNVIEFLGKAILSINTK